MLCLDPDPGLRPGLLHCRPFGALQCAFRASKTVRLNQPVMWIIFQAATSARVPLSGLQILELLTSEPSISLNGRLPLALMSALDLPDDFSGIKSEQ